MAANKRIYFACQQAGIAVDNSSTFTAIHGLQSVGMTTNFNLVNVIEIGQLTIYESIENIPDVQVSLTKVLDGAAPIYCLSTQNALTPTLAGRSTDKCLFGLSIFSDTAVSATGTPSSEVVCSGMFISSVTYNFPLDDNFSEEAALVGNNKVWKNDPKFVGGPTAFVFTGGFNNADSPPGSGGVNRRQDLFITPTITGVDAAHLVLLDNNNMVADYDCTILPPEVFGISTSGTNVQTSGVFGTHLASIKVSCDFGRDSINELGRKGPYHRVVKFPVDVTTEIEVTSISGDMISATEGGIYTTSSASCSDLGNLKNRTIRIATCEGLRVYTGLKNKLSSVNYTGGDSGGSNVTCTYSFLTQNNFTVMHQQDPNVNFVWGTGAKNLYLVN